MRFAFHSCRNIDKDLAFLLPLLADQAANMKVQIFVLRKDTADIIGNLLLIVRKLRESKPANLFFITSCLGKRQGEAAGPARIKPLAH